LQADDGVGADELPQKRRRKPPGVVKYHLFSSINNIIYYGVLTDITFLDLEKET